MKKFILVIAAALICAVASAQVGKFAVGVNGMYGCDSENFGIGVKAQYGVLDALRGEVGVNYFLKKNGYKSYEANLNVQYLFNLSGVTIYPLAGFNYTVAKISKAIEALTNYSATIKKAGFQAGVGVEVPLSDAIALQVEGRYLFGDFKQFIPTIGVTFAL